MLGSSRTNEKGKGPAYANIKIEEVDDFPNSIDTNVQAASGMNFGDGNFDGDDFDFLKITDDMLLSIPDWEDIHQSVPQGIPESIGITNPNSFENPKINPSPNTANMDIQGVSLLPEWNMGWGQQCIDQGQRPTSAGYISTFGEESSFGNSNRAQVVRDFSSSSFRFQPTEIAAHTRTNVNFDSSQCGVQGKVGGTFLSLGIGGDVEAISRAQSDNKKISNKLKEAASAELKYARARHLATQTLDADFMGFQRNISGISNQFSNVDQMKLTTNETGVHSTLSSGMGSNELKIALARQVTGQPLDADSMGFQRNHNGSSNQFIHVDGMRSSENGVGVHSTLNRGMGSSPHHILQMQQNAMQHGRNISSVNLNDYRAFLGNQAVHSGTPEGNLTRSYNSRQHNLNRFSKPEFVKPSWLASCMLSEQPQNIRSRTTNSLSSESSMNSTQLNNAGQFISQNAMPTPLLSQRTAAPQVSWVGSGPASIDEPFPKRLGVEFSGRISPQAARRHFSPVGTSLQATSTGQHISQHVTQRIPAPWLGGGLNSSGEQLPQSLGFEFSGKNSFQAAQRHLSSVGTSLQATSTGQICEYPDKGSICLPEHVVRPSTGQSQVAMTQLPMDPRGAALANASTVRPHLKRTAAVPHQASDWVQRQRIRHPTIHHSVPKQSMTVRPIHQSMLNPSSTVRTNPVTTAHVHRFMPGASQTQPAGSVAGRVAPRMHPSIPPHFRPRVPVATAPAVSHVKWTDPDATPKMTGYKCLLCKRDLALTSEGAVFQPAAPPPVAVLPCGHTFHDQCLENITPKDQAKDPPCIPCAIGEN
uniref:uncharacterized protein LOC122606811 isoform X2 n=1 Tax=Erigeron canadensis TaxID=72917 RepID=UPI001CB9D1B0|nr:uncharacterized protein LOC122606811 isoform X2 [Erigeron canadensis]